MAGDIRSGFVRPITGNFFVLERSTGVRFRLGDRILEHRGLSGSYSRRKTGIAGGFGIIADPEIDTAVGGKKNGILGDEIIVNPTGRRSQREAGKNNDNASTQVAPDSGLCFEQGRKN